MASSWGRFAWIVALVALFTLPRLRAQEVLAGAAPPPSTQAADPADPSAVCAVVDQGVMVHVFDTSSLAGGPYYVNDHTLSP